ncbi:MlaD family protein [Chitinibacter sp. ZOR0017]|uniref:MlaD family protein n=1 Tax=Chitinibacter sp. ZOR0017 TaxID=1339254 RepID=UPI000648FD35|nr:MlaD family protein [Chitinibacter sp. ZOR0017]
MKNHQYLKDNDPRFHWLGWRVGVFALGIAILIITLLAVLAERQGLFNAKDRLHFVAESGAGLTPGMQVRLSGFRIGVVDEVALNEQAKVDVELLIEQRYMKWIKTDSIAILQQDGLIGDHFIEISGGGAKTPAMQEGGVLSFAPALGIADIALDLRNRTMPIFESVQQTLDYINDPKGDLRQTVHNVQQLTAEVRQTREKLDQILAHTDTLLDGEARQTLRSADQLLQRADQIASEVAQRTPQLLTQTASLVATANAIAQDASATMSQVRRVTEQAAPQIPGLVRNTDGLVRRSEQTLRAVQRIWPLSRTIEQAPVVVPAPESR